MTEANEISAQKWRMLIWIAFVALTMAVSARQPGWDLRGEYVAARLIAAGEVSALYDQAAGDAAKQQNSAWSSAALAGGITDRVVVSYIKTPLWSWLMSPLAGAVSFAVFRTIFAALSAMAMAALVFLTARQWAPRLMAPGWQAAILASLFLTVPFFSSLVLSQTHVLFVFLVVLACIAALNDRPLSGGALLALAASVKITPLWIAVTWLVGGRARAAVSFALCSCLLVALTLLETGWQIFGTFVQTLQRFSGTVLLSGNNCSLASVLLGKSLDEDTAYRWQTVPFPLWANLVSVGAVAAVAVIGGLLDRRPGLPPELRTGAILTLVAATAFSPLAWNHYFIVLIVPVMLMLDASRGPARPFWGLLVFFVFALDVPPLAFTIGAPLPIVALRSEFWAAVLCLFALPALVVLRRKKDVLF
jgi:hypothetical protein